jgi:outer membrane protein assembly factor BamE (lipoprotein component of BamABCDE complex)
MLFKFNQRKQMKKFIAMMAVLVLTACAGSGSIKWDDARKLKVGMTEKEVTAVMGSPYQAQGQKDGTYTWVWVDVNLMRGGSQKMTAEFKKGVVVSIPEIPESFGK